VYLFAQVFVNVEGILAGLGFFGKVLFRGWVESMEWFFLREM